MNLGFFTLATLRDHPINSNNSQATTLPLQEVQILWPAISALHHHQQCSSQHSLQPMPIHPRQKPYAPYTFIRFTSRHLVFLWSKREPFHISYSWKLDLQDFRPRTLFWQRHLNPHQRLHSWTSLGDSGFHSTDFFISGILDMPLYSGCFTMQVQPDPLLWKSNKVESTKVTHYWRRN